jgi:hypothetical protein
MRYPISYPFAKFFQYFGMTLIVRIDVIFDDEAKVYVATSKDVSGLVLEAETFQTLESEVREAIVNLAAFDKTIRANTNADLIYCDHIAIA